MAANAATALGQLGRAGEAAQVWLTLAGDKKVNTWPAVEESGRFADARILPVLERPAQKDKSEHVRHAAQRAIERIRQWTGRG